MSDFAQRRSMMVDTQVRPSDVTKFPIIDALLAIPREEFVTGDLREAAYLGENLVLGPGALLLEPRTLAKVLDALNVTNQELVLDIGSALGYSAAVIARMAQVVVAVEADEARAAEAQTNLADADVDNVIVQCAALHEGAPEHGPYDVIIVQGGVEAVPQAILSQLKTGGRIACVFMEGALGTVRLGHKRDDGVDWRFVFNAAAPVLPGFEQERAFAL